MLYHRQQPELYGCMYHALYAVTGDDAVLQHAHDLSNARFYARIHALGAMVVTAWADFGNHAAVCGPELWRALVRSQPQTFLLTVPAERLPGHRHLIAVEISWAGARISDSRRPAIQAMTFEEFLASPLHQAYLVEQVASADVDDYPYEDAAVGIARALAASRPDPHPDLTF